MFIANINGQGVLLFSPLGRFLFITFIIITGRTYTYYLRGPPPRRGNVKKKLLTTCEYFLKFVIYFRGGLWFNLLMKFETGTQVQHRDNPNWKAVVVRDLEPRRPVNGVVAVNHNGRVSGMSKTLLRVSFHADAKKEFGEFVD